MQRPNVIVFQEYENITVAPDIPDLNVIIVGYAYQILDYLDDKTNCQASVDYGTLDGAIPVAGTDNFTSPLSVVLSDPPNVETGAILQEDSVSIFFDAARAVVTEHDGAANSYGRFSANDNLFWAHGGVSTSGQHLGVAGVAAGDILFVQQNAGASADNKKTVRELCYTLYDNSGTALTFVTNGVAPGDTVTIWTDAAATSRDGSYTVKRVIDETTLELEEALPGVGNLAASAACDIRIQAPSGVVRVENIADASLYDWCNARMNSDFGADYVGPPPGASTEKWRFERELSDVELDATDYSISGNQITINAGITTDITSTLLAKDVTYAEIYVEYQAQRTDLQDVTTLSSSSEMSTTLGKLDARNPLYVGAYVAALNTTTPVKIYGLGNFATEELAYLDFIDRISAERDIYAIVPLTYNSTVLATLKSMAENLADPNYVLSTGIKQKFRMILGAIELVTLKEIFAITSGASILQKSGTAPVVPTNDDYRLLEISGTSLPTLGNAGAKVVPGDKVSVKLWTGAVNETHEFTISHYNGTLSTPSREVLEVDIRTSQPVTQQGLPVWGAAPASWDNWTTGYDMDNTGIPGGNEQTLDILDAVTGLSKIGGAITVGTVAADLVVEAKNLDDYFLILQVPGASFITDGVTPGDLLQMPVDCESNPSNWDTATLQEWEVNTVLSEERVEIKNEGTNTSTVANELPHYFKRALVSGQLEDVTNGQVYFRIMRDMDKTQQVDAMVAVASSYSSMRLLLAYPDEIDISGLVDGSKDRSGSSTPAEADPQPGYYLAAAIGGQTAGQPSQQGFTNLGISGVTRVYNSGDYFNEQQVTDLSNGGVYVFIQDNPAALPYSVHEVTTDTTSLETGEYMSVKNFDFVAWTFLDILLPFLGIWNVTPETVEFIRQALKTTGDNLKSRYVSKIGPPLVDYVIDNVEESDLSTDRIEAYVSVDLPMVLNTIGLHLVA
jgi:hypothetical protein